MNLLEYEAKQLLSNAGIPVPAGVVVRQDSRISMTAPLVVKSQVPIGGRGKLGGIKIVDSNEDILMAISKLFEHRIKGYLPSSLLLEEKLSIEKELYLALTINRGSSSIQLMAHPQGGVEVESNEASDFLTINLGVNDIRTVGEQLAEHLSIPEQAFALQDFAEHLLDCFKKNDAMLIEINPLVLTTDGRIIAGDCKMTLDQSSIFRHPEWNFEQKDNEVNFVTLNRFGDVATIANGAGLAMATMDAVADAGMHPANFLDIGGGASADSVMSAFRRIMEYPEVKVIVINIFAGITRCDEVARAIIEARKGINSLPPLCIRLAGTNFEQAETLLNAENIQILPTLKSCLDSAKGYTS